MDYSSPTLDALFDIFAAYHQGKASQEEVLALISEVGEHVEDYLDALEEQAEAGQVDVEDRGFQMIREGFEEHLEGLELLAEDPEEPFDGLNLIQSAINRMVYGRRLLMARARAASSVACVYCSAENPIGETRCQACFRRLPVAGDAASSTTSVSIKEGRPGTTEVLTEEFVTLSRAVESWKRGELSVQGLRSTLDEIADSLGEHLAENRTLPDQLASFGSTAVAQGRELANRTSQALQTSLEALQKMGRTFETDDGSYLENGLHDFYVQAKVLVGCHRELTSLEETLRRFQ